MNRHPFLHKRHAGGYAALASALIIATLLSVTVFATGNDAYLARFDTIDHVDHLQAKNLAISCVYAAAYALAVDHAYTVPPTGTTVFVGSPTQSCRIEHIDTVGATKLIYTSAQTHAATAHLAGVVTIPSPISLPQLVSWKEMNAPYGNPEVLVPVLTKHP